MPHILIDGQIHHDAVEILEHRDDVTIEVIHGITPGDFRAYLAEADGLIVRTMPLDADTISVARRLRVVSRHGVGYDGIAVDALTMRGIPLTVVGSVNAETVAEHVLFLILALARRCVLHDRAVRAGQWEVRNEFASTELCMKTLLLLGFGRIGREVAKRARAFDLTVLAYDPYVDASVFAASGVTKVDDWRALLPIADVVSVHVPRGAETDRMIGAPDLARMKWSAFLINTARGGIVDEAALSEALSTGRIAGAGIDVFDTEPPPTSSPLLTCENVIFSPHTASLTGECVRRMSITAAENILAAFDGNLDPALVVNQHVLRRASRRPL